MYINIERFVIMIIPIIPHFCWFAKNTRFPFCFTRTFIQVQCLKCTRDKTRAAMTDNESVVLHSEHSRLYQAMSTATKDIIKLNSSVSHVSVSRVKRTHVIAQLCVYMFSFSYSSQGQVLAEIYERSI